MTSTPDRRSPEVAIIAMGDMGSWIATRLISRGVSVRTVLAGRGEQSVARATAAGVRDAGNDQAMVEGADVLLSIVPPGVAYALAERLAPALAGAEHKPVYVDCNAVSRSTVQRVEARIAATGCGFVDAGILGPAPKGDGPSPRIYLSGAAAQRITFLGDHGLEIRVLEAPVGGASALKCCYAALGKGLTALAVETVLAADRAEVADVLRREVAAHLPDLARLLSRLIPDSYDKAYRWVAEMEEIAGDFAGVPGGPASYHAAAAVFQALAASATQGRADGSMVATLDSFATALKPG